jgi:hypothetical protein
MPAKPRVDWSEQLRLIRERMMTEPVPAGATVADIITVSTWAFKLTESDLRFLKTLRIEA